MNKQNIIGLTLILLSLFIISNLYAADDGLIYDDPFEDPFEEEVSELSSSGIVTTIPDPIQAYNRMMFSFNEGLYFYVLKPAARAYSVVMPEKACRGIKRFFNNLSMPSRAINCLLQGKVKGAGIELSRFAINTTVGVAGFLDPASSFGLEQYNEDTGQTLGLYGIGDGCYVVLPYFGPSSVRDTVGLVTDLLLHPLVYVKIKLWENPALRAYETVNNTSMRIGEYEDLKKAALDPYVSFRNAYYQYRASEIKK